MSEENSKPNYLNIWNEFQKTALKFPHKLAIVDGSNSITYKNLYRKSYLLSEKISKFSKNEKNLKLDNSRFVAVLLNQGFNFITSTFAIYHLGKIFLPISSSLPSEKIKELLKEANSPLLITSREIYNELQLPYENAYFVQDGIEDENYEIKEEILKIPITTKEEIANCYFTSGSTGLPKGVLIAHKTLILENNFHVSHLNVTHKDKIPLFLNHSYALSLREVLGGVFSGCTLYVIPDELRYDINKLRNWTKETEISLIWMVCSTAAIFMDAPPSEFSPALRAVTFAGEKFKGKFRCDNRFSRHYTYGNTESFGISCFEVPSVFEEEVLPVGTPFPPVKILIVDANLAPVKKGEVGEICVGGDFISAGYYNRPDLDEIKFCNLNDSKFVRTGDEGYFMENGNLVLRDRSDNMVKINGNRFELGELEKWLVKIDGISEAVATFQKATSRIHAFYIVKDGHGEISTKDIRKFLESKLPHFGMPASLTRLSKFPLNSNGKIDRIFLLSQINENLIIVPPSNSTEKLILDAWAKVLNLNVSQISTDVNYFSIGGNSLKISQILAEINSSKMSIATFFKNPTIQKQGLILNDDKNISDANKNIDILSEIQKYEAKLDEFQLQFPEILKFSNSGHIFLTGATGYLGSYILLKLIEKESANNSDKIYCLIRSTDVQNAKNRLIDSILQFHHFETQKEASDWLDKNNSKIQLLSGDVSKLNLGLSLETYEKLSFEISRVFHCASEVNLLKRYEDLIESNIVGVINIIKFCGYNKTKTLCHVSTVAVDKIETVFDSSSNNNTAKEDLNGYRLSKFIGEALVEKIIAKNCAALIFRPGVIGSHSTNKKICNNKDFIYIFIKFCSEINAVPEIDFTFQFGSLDYVASKILDTLKNHCSSDIEQNKCKFKAWEKEENFSELVKSELQYQNLETLSLLEWKSKLLSISDNKEERKLLIELIDLQLSSK